MVTNVEAQQFLTIFLGKTNTYVKNSLPKEAPKAGQKIKTDIINVEGKVDRDLMTSHLEGEFGVGICPVNAEGKCRFGVLDIDYYGADIKKMLHFIKEYQLPLLPFRSKSGGLHVYLFLTKAVSAKNMRETLSLIAYYFSLENIYGKGKVEIFPKQDKAEGFGSSITLPYFNCSNPYTYLLDLEGNPVEFKEALTYITKHFTSLDIVEDTLSNLPYNDAPPCLQRILLSESVGGEDTGRNNFIYSFGVYAKKKYGSGFEKYVHEVNNSFEVPLDESSIEHTIESVRSNEYIYKCKDIPCNAFCDKILCKKREFGLGRDKSHFTGIDYGQLFRYKAEEPYYVWQLRLQGQEKWVDVTFKDEGYILDQRNFAKLCVRYLNRAPMQVSNNDWYNTLNTVLPKVIDIEVPKETDTSATSALRDAFNTYLADKQSRRDSPFQIRVGLSVRQVEHGHAKYYFTHKGFTDYLKAKKVPFDMGLMREQLKSFGAVEDNLVYTNAMGDTVTFPCWSKSEDDIIKELYEGIIEVENGDKEKLGIGVSEATNVTEIQVQSEVEKPYTEGDKKDVEAML